MSLDAVSDYVTEARVLLQDQVAPYRYTDPNLVAALNMAVQTARRVRPDLFLGASSALPVFVNNDSTAVVIDQMYRPALLYYICGNAHLRDEESPEENRALMYFGLFSKQLTTLGL